MVVAVLAGVVWADPARADRTTDRQVDRLMMQLGRPRTRDEARKRLEALGDKAVGRLVHHVRGSNRIRRILALSAMQYVWSDEALEAVTTAAGSEDVQTRRLARVVLRRNLSDADYRAAMEKVAGDGGAAGAEAGRGLLERKPDVETMLDALGQAAGWPELAPLLPRYYSGKLTKATRRMLRSAHPDVKRFALLALLFQNDAEAATRRSATMLLGHGRPAIRDLACEYLRYHGTDRAAGHLRRVSRRDPDLWVRASAAAALEAIQRRAGLFADGPDAPEAAEDDSPARRMLELAGILRDQPSQARRQAGLRLLSESADFAPWLAYAQMDVKSRREMLTRQHARLVLLNAVAGYDPARASHLANRTWRQVRSTGSGEPDMVPEVDRAVPPIRDYFDPRRESFGRRIGDTGGAFANSVHVGDDCGGGQDHTTVAAIADGVVRHLGIGSISWGTIVVIEHRLEDGERFCSLYAHLGPVPCVSLGQLVEAGDKLGSLGRAFTFDNGGYMTHLHFGIHAGPFGDGRWITGYVNPKRFRGDHAGWRDPQAFVKRLMRD
jgi:murein DD-endopeptidase MepM/ murein hydrolase activator NlpD